MNFSQSVEYMQGLLRFGEKYGNERFETLLEMLGNPHHRLKALHVAGTKGKGSTVTFIASVLSAAGYRTGAYLSPYVYDLRERIQIDGSMIPMDDFARWVTEIRPMMEMLGETDLGPTTEFELKTAVAFCYFAEQNVDYAVIEVGLGGRLDATNVLPNPIVSVITNIGYDHVEILGDTLELIASEKAGIIKQRGLCVTGIEPGPALSTVQDVCNRQNARLIEVVAGRDWQSSPDGSFAVNTMRRSLSNITLQMRGQFQHANAALALCAVDAANIPEIPDAAAIKGLESAYAPGRMEVVREANPTVILDAAHNELAAQVLADSLMKGFRANRRPLVLVVGLSRRHEPSDLLKALLRLQPRLLIATEPSFRPRPAADIVDAAKESGVGTMTCIPVPAALTAAFDSSSQWEDTLIVVTGSFFTVGDLPESVRESTIHAV